MLPHAMTRRNMPGNSLFRNANELAMASVKQAKAKRDSLAADDAPRRNDYTAPIGGLIEIHGEGGKGVNWTKGCNVKKNGLCLSPHF
ncbi:hypothetical protein JXA70_00830 [candidate division KSB1 bacterium]|nr:hypothetical protein [candidate division KSB1 bacterium]